MRDVRAVILNAAEQLLAESDLYSVTVRAIAERIGMTDMGVLHHFGSRDELLLSLVRHLGMRLRAELEMLAEDWARNGARVGVLVEALFEFYASGRGGLAIALHQAGWRNGGPPVLEPVVEAVHSARVRQLGAEADRDETRLAVSAIHQACALDGHFGFEFRRNAGFIDSDAGAIAHRRWWSATIIERLRIPP